MSTQEFNSLKELFEEKLKSLHIQLNSEFEVLNNRLETIEEQVKKTNGRTIKLEELTNLHTLSINQYSNKCPQEARIRTVEDNLLTGFTVKKWIIGTLGVISIIVGIIYTLIKIFV